MILGDSLLVMTSLAEKEGLKGKVQMIYIDPPYGIKFGSNWQVSTRKRDVKDGSAEDATRQPEQIRAFRDTWQLGIHSYLNYLRDRLIVARELLTESGSLFVQIGDENVHLVRSLLDEVFGSENFAGIIMFVKTASLGSDLLSPVGDYLIWYAKEISRIKYRPLFMAKELGGTGGGQFYGFVQLKDGTHRRLTQNEMDDPTTLPEGTKPYQLSSLSSQSGGEKSSFSVKFGDETFLPGRGFWKTNEQGISKLINARRVKKSGSSIRYVRFLDDFPAAPVTSLWTDTGTGSFTEDKVYVVQTSTKVVQRCILMTTDPGDLVLDPTCVRKGTRVLTPLNPPVSGGKKGGLPASGRKTNSSLPVNGGKDVSPSPHAGRAGVGPIGVGSVPIEDLQPGDYVYAHDGQPHRVSRIIKKRYSGKMIGIRQEGCNQNLWLTTDHLVLANRRVQALSEHGGWSGIPPTHFERAKKLRTEMSPPERLLWSRLRSEQLGVKFRRQHPIGPYIVDFYTRDAGLVIEVDGSQHYESEAIEYDGQRDAFLQSMGLRVIRFNASQVSRNLSEVVDTIFQAAREQVLPEDLSKQWRYAENLAVGDTVYMGVDQQPCKIVELRGEQSVEDVYDLEVEEAHSFLTEVCAVHNCGSGTTAFVAEQWGRRWITVDTSRVAIALARTRLMAAKYPYYLLADSPEGLKKEMEASGKLPIKSPGGFEPPGDKSPASSPRRLSNPVDWDIKKGFVYKRVPHVTLKSIANNPDIKEGMSRAEIDKAIARHADTELLYDQPYEDNKRIRVSGPFTVESLSPHRVLAADVERPAAETEWQKQSAIGQFETLIIDNLKKAGVQNTVKNERLKFDRLESFAGTWLHATGEYSENPHPKTMNRLPAPVFFNNSSPIAKSGFMRAMSTCNLP